MIVDRYLFREVWHTLLAVFVVLLIIIGSDWFMRYLGDVAAGVLPVNVVFTLLAFKMLNYVALLLSVAFYLGLMVALGRWYKDNEITALASCGVGPVQLLRPIAFIGTGVMLLVAASSFYISPWAAQQGYEQRQKAERIADLSAIAAGRFVESNLGDWVFYAEGLSPDAKSLSNVFVQTRREDKVDVFSAQSAFFQREQGSGDRMLNMFDGYRYQGTPGRADYKILQYKKQVVRMREPDTVLMIAKGNRSSTATLMKSKETADIAELQWRVSIPLSIPVLALLGLLLSPTTPGQGRYIYLFTSLLVYVVYNNLLGIAQNWVERGRVPADLGVWWVHGLMLIVIAVLWLKRFGLDLSRTRVLERRAAAAKERP